MRHGRHFQLILFSLQNLSLNYVFIACVVNYVHIFSYVMLKCFIVYVFSSCNPEITAVNFVRK